VIEKKRLEELIEQGATVYESDFFGVNAINIKKGDYVEQNGTLHTKEFAGAYDYFYNEKLFETKEEAEWHKEFGCIERTERLELPTWEELFKQDRFLDCYTQEFAIVNNLSVMGVALFGVDFTNKIIEVSIGSDKLFVEELTKENYTLACRKAKELFLGEKK